MKKTIGILIIFLLIAEYIAAVNTVILTNDGKEYEGEIITDTSKSLTIDTKNGLVRIKKTDIKSRNDVPEIATAIPAVGTQNFIENTIDPNNKKLTLIYKEIIHTENILNSSATVIVLVPVAAGTLLGLLHVLIKPEPGEDSVLPIIDAGVGLAAGLVVAINTFIYLDGLSTIGHLRAKKYDLMMYPYYQKETIAGNKSQTLGFGLKIQI